MLVAVTQMILAKLAGGITFALEQACDGRVFFIHTLFSARQADFTKPGAEYTLSGNKRRPACRAALLTVIVGKHHTFVGDPVNIGCLVTHQTPWCRH